ncbi:phosphatase PAP2 family protein [Streptomyces lavendulae]|uniref:phosphatase PAP2 family protein n=1 Tax=Streptomyces lavendulae TaxID=1914 RepID=UPI00340364F7
MARPCKTAASPAAAFARALVAAARAASGPLLAFAAVYLVAVWTPFGQRAENALVAGYADGAWMADASQSWGPPPLTHDLETIAVGLTVIASIATTRRRWLVGCTAIVAALGPIAASQVLKNVLLLRPDLVGADDNLVEVSFPSGHVTLTAALVAGVALVASERRRPVLAAVGAAWLAMTAGAVQALYWHRPSDVFGATLLACASYCAAHRFLHPGSRPSVPRPRAWTALLLAAASAVAGAGREGAVAGPLVFSSSAWICAALLWIVLTRAEAAPPRLPRPAVERR